MPDLSRHQRMCLDLAREAGNRLYDPSTGLCLISRDTLWYAIALLFDPASDRRALGEHLLGTVRSEDGTHTPATMLAVLYGCPDRLPEHVRQHLHAEVERELVHAADARWRDGNVNHPLGAYCSLILGGELVHAPWAVDLGTRLLRELQQMTGDRQFSHSRQAELSEYNSPTYTALSLVFLAMIASYARSPAARELALFLEQRLWIDVALHYHAPSQQFAGPHSRSYQDDSTGGYSALHTMLALATGVDIFLHPELCVRFNHPSSLLQPALAALVPYHMTAEAREIAFRKEFPFLMRKTTYCEQYHENSRHAEPDGSPTFAFDDEVYPGGLRDLVTFMTPEYALGTSSLPYVNGGHTESFMLRIRRTQTPAAMGDFRSAFTRGVFNGATVGQRNSCHVTGTDIDESYLYEEGRCATFQHRNRAIVLYHPKRAGHRGVTQFRTDLIFSYFSPFTQLRLGDIPVTGLPMNAPPGTPLIFQDHQTFGVIIPLGPVPSTGKSAIRTWTAHDHLMYSLVSYEAAERDFTRDEIMHWRSGFGVELATIDDFPSFEAFHAYARTLTLTDSGSNTGIITVSFRGPAGVLQMGFEPAAGRFAERTWNGQEYPLSHLEIASGPHARPLLNPLTIFGSEAMRSRP